MWENSDKTGLDTSEKPLAVHVNEEEAKGQWEPEVGGEETEEPESKMAANNMFG